MPGWWRQARLARRFRAWARPRQPEALPATLDRHRVYVLPTRFGLFFALLLLVMGLGALNYNNNPALLLALLLTGAANASLLAAHLQLTGLQVAAIDAEPVPAGMPLQVRVHARAKPGRERRGLRLDTDSASAGLSLVDGSGKATLSLPTVQRGWLSPGRLRISTTRPLGIARAWAYAWPETALLVYPAPEAHGPPLPRGAGEASAARLDPAGDDVHHLRAYRRGDSRSDLVLVWNALSGLDREARIRRLARWVDEAERGSRHYRLQLPGMGAIGPASGSAHRHACLRALALLPA